MLKSSSDSRCGGVGEGGGSQIIPSTGSSNAHLQKLRKTQGHNCWWSWGTQIEASEEATACLGPSQSCPRGASVPVFRIKPITMGQQEHLSDSGRLLPRGMGCIMRCKGRTFGDDTRLTVGCLVEEPKVGKGRARGHLGRNKCRNKRDDGVIKG